MGMFTAIRNFGFAIADMLLLNRQEQPKGQDILEIRDQLHVEIGRVSSKEEYWLMVNKVVDFERICSSEPEGYLMIDDLKDHLVKKFYSK